VFSLTIAGQETHFLRSPEQPARIFDDVPPESPFADYIALMDQYQITAGCSAVPRLYCPDSEITRGQAATFISRWLMGEMTRQEGPRVPFPFSDVPYFEDVPSTDPLFRFVQKVRQLEITTGCSTAPALFCPSAPVTRGQMAVFLVRAVSGDAFSFPTAQRFTDVPSNHPFFRYIQKLKEMGVTSGCSTTEFCPDTPITRRQMAAFFIRALHPERRFFETWF
jgi:hypothetical protein